MIQMIRVPLWPFSAFVPSYVCIIVSPNPPVNRLVDVFNLTQILGLIFFIPHFCSHLLVDDENKDTLLLKLNAGSIMSPCTKAQGANYNSVAFLCSLFINVIILLWSRRHFAALMAAVPAVSDISIALYVLWTIVGEIAVTFGYTIQSSSSNPGSSISPCIRASEDDVAMIPILSGVSDIIEASSTKQYTFERRPNDILPRCMVQDPSNTWLTLESRSFQMPYELKLVSRMASEEPERSLSALEYFQDYSGSSFILEKDLDSASTGQTLFPDTPTILLAESSIKYNQLFETAFQSENQCISVKNQLFQFCLRFMCGLLQVPILLTSASYSLACRIFGLVKTVLKFIIVAVLWIPCRLVAMIWAIFQVITISKYGKSSSKKSEIHNKLPRSPVSASQQFALPFLHTLMDFLQPIPGPG